MSGKWISIESHPGPRAIRRRERESSISGSMPTRTIDRLRRIERMAATVARRDVYWWTEQELAAA